MPNPPHAQRHVPCGLDRGRHLADMVVPGFDFGIERVVLFVRRRGQGQVTGGGHGDVACG